MGRPPRATSVWPPFVALGIASTEVGVLFGLVPVAVGGVLLFGGGCAGLAREAGYAETVWGPLRLVGVVIGTAGAAVWLWRSAALTPRALRVAVATDPFAVRAAVVLGAAVLLVVAGSLAPQLAGRRVRG